MEKAGNMELKYTYIFVKELRLMSCFSKDGLRR
jgi:hypothetical protein